MMCVDVDDGVLQGRWSGVRGLFEIPMYRDAWGIGILEGSWSGLFDIFDHICMIFDLFMLYLIIFVSF